MNKLALALLFVSAFQPAWADQVVPSDRVTTQLNVRHHSKAFYTTVSDHLPLRAQFRSGPDDD